MDTIDVGASQSYRRRRVKICLIKKYCRPAKDDWKNGILSHLALKNLEKMRLKMHQLPHTMRSSTGIELKS